MFSRHYVQVPTCGASRCALLRGRYPTEPAQVRNDAIRTTHTDWGSSSLPAWFRRHVYRTLALGKITHHPGGLTGKGWAEGPEELPGVWDRSWIPDGPWQTPEAMMHGYANGVARTPGKSPPWEAFDGPDEAYPDAWVAAEAIRTLQELAKANEPWFFGVGFFRPHLPFAAPKRWFDLRATGVPDLNPAVAAKPPWPSGWHASGEFRKNYGHPSGRDPDTDPDYARPMRQAYAASVSYMDAQLADPAASSAKPAHGFWTGGQRTVRTDRWRLIVRAAEDDSVTRVELFDYRTDPDESRNRAEDHPEVVRELTNKLGCKP